MAESSEYSNQYFYCGKFLKYLVYQKHILLFQPMHTIIKP